MTIRTKKAADRLGIKRFSLYIIIFAVIAVNVISAIAIIAIEKQQVKNAADEYRNIAIIAHANSEKVDFSTLQTINPDIRAWIVSEGTGVDYPVVQGEDNNFYRNHLFSGSSNRFGCLFIDADCSGDFSDKNTVIYGGAQFKALYNYASQDYYELVPDITMFTPDATRTILLYACVITDDILEAVKADFSSDNEFAEYISWLGENSEFSSNISISAADNIITLCVVGDETEMVLVGRIQ